MRNKKKRETRLGHFSLGVERPKKKFEIDNKRGFNSLRSPRAARNPFVSLSRDRARGSFLLARKKRLDKREQQP